MRMPLNAGGKTVNWRPGRGWRRQTCGDEVRQEAADKTDLGASRTSWKFTCGQLHAIDRAEREPTAKMKVRGDCDRGDYYTESPLESRWAVPSQ